MKNGKYLVMLLIAIAIIAVSCEEPNDNPLTIEDSDPIADIDGNIYNTVKINNQIWSTENLNVSHFRNGDSIAEAKTNAEWVKASVEGNPAWCYYDNDTENGKKYAKLYNWYAINDPRGLAPDGWHVPTIQDWTRLTDYSLGGTNEAGIQMKSNTGWNSGGNGNNTSRFNAFPGGGRIINGDFSDIGAVGIWWSSSENMSGSAWGYQLSSVNNSVLQGSFDKGTGLSVRLVKIVNSDGPPGVTLSERLQEAIDDGLNLTDGKGISVAVILANGWQWAGVSGYSHGTVKITPNMRFSAGSIEKIFTAAAILQLAEEDKLTLDDSLYKWLPAYPYIDSTITIRQLLNHTSGINDIVDNNDFWESIFAEPSRVWNPEDMILTFNRESLFPKGTDWSYSTTGYILLRMIVMKITGIQMSTVNRERFFTPLELNNSYTSMGEDLPDNIAHGWYDMNKDGNYEDLFNWPRTAFASGIAGEVWSTAEDLAKWARALFYDKTVLTQSSLDQMLTFHSPCTGEEFLSAGYGLGVAKFNPQVFNGLEAYGHGGHGPGYAAGTIFLPEYNVCIGFMDNTDGGESVSVALSNLLDVITDYLYGE